MKIGVLSDTHNHLPNLRAALDLFRKEDIDTLIHCGDLTNVETARTLQGFRVIFAFGNGDILSGEIRAALLELNPENYAGSVYTGRIGGARIAAAHGHQPGMVDGLIRSGDYDYVFTGHSHRRQDDIYGFTRRINPGALGGLRRDDRQVCVVDLATAKVKFLKIPQ
jgi:uncharacterized protein